MTNSPWSHWLKDGIRLSVFGLICVAVVSALGWGFAGDGDVRDSITTFLLVACAIFAAVAAWFHKSPAQQAVARQHAQTWYGAHIPEEADAAERRQLEPVFWHATAGALFCFIALMILA